MRNKHFVRLSCLLVIAILLTGAAPVSAEGLTDPVGEVQALIGDIIGCKQSAADAGTVQDWIDGALTEQAGVSSEWYVITLSQVGDYDFSAYEAALLAYLDTNDVKSASTRLKYALALAAVGSDAPDITETLGSSIGQQGIMSWIYGLHLLNNGYPCASFTTQAVTEQILSMQLDDGGWALSGTVGDVDVTAMAVQALAPQAESDAAVKTAVDRAVELLSARQLEDGDYKSYGAANPESTAQVITALTSLGIDALSDGRFIKNGNTLLDGLTKYRLSDGSFSHKHGETGSETATAQAFYALVSCLRLAEGKSGLYLLDHCDPSSVAPETPPATTAATTAAAFAEIMPGVVPYKPIAAAVIVGIALLACLILFAANKRHKKNFLAVLIVTSLALAFVFLTDFAAADSYYHGGTVKENAVGSVSLSIRCDTVAGEADHIPKNGIILDQAEFAIAQGDTVFDILMEAAKTYQIHMESSGAEGMRYVSGINYLYEFDFGDLSGWIYAVNGASSSVGCDQYVLSDGDAIAWHYTCTLGEDIER